MTPAPPNAARMEQLIPIINRLQDVMTSVGVSSVITGSSSIDLPQIAVVGSQSVGKSSVLESLVGRDFLPRGSGIVTRRPLILQLHNIQPPEADVADANEPDDFTEEKNLNENSEKSAVRKSGGPVEWGEFGHAIGVQFDDFDAIRKEIERETERTTGKNKGISPHPIMLKIYSPSVIDLTLIDLPGITKVPVGDQPPDIEIQIRRMIYSFISRPNCIVLAVTAANTDLANSDALQMAREVDPDGRRTLGVITKCDLMDADTDAMDMLMGKVYPLRLGYVGVVCRSQKDINNKIEIRNALKEEERFFRTHPSYRHLSHRCGTKHLAVMLNQILMHHIQETLPELKQRIHTLVQDYESELQSYGDPLGEAHGNPGALLLHFFSKFARNFQDAIEGRLNLMNCSDQLTGGARINYIFHDWFGKALCQFDPLDGLSDLEIRTAIRNATGPKASLFVPEGAFEILVRKQIAKLEPPALQCVDQVYEELQKIVEKCELSEMSRFNCLKDRLLEVVKGVLKRCLRPTNQMISNLIQMELAYFNTNHPDFVGGNRVVQSRNHHTSSDSHLAPQHRQSSHSVPPIHSNESNQQLLQDAANIAVSGNSRQHVPQSPQLATGSTASTTPEPQHLYLPPEQTALPPATMQQTGGFLGFFKGGRSNSANPQAMPQAMPLNSNFSANPTTMEALGQLDQSQMMRNPQLPPPYPSRHHFQHQPHPRFASPTYPQVYSGGVHLPQVPAIVTPNEIPSDRERTEIELIKSLIISYFNIVRKNVADYVPKSIMSFMVNTAKDVVQKELVSQLYKEELFDELLREGDDVSEARRQCKSTLQTLRAAMDIVHQIRDFDLDEF